MGIRVNTYAVFEAIGGRYLTKRANFGESTSLCVAISLDILQGHLVVSPAMRQDGVGWRFSGSELTHLEGLGVDEAHGEP